MKSVHPKGRTTMRTAHRPDDAALGDLRAVARQALTRRGMAPTYGWATPTTKRVQPRLAHLGDDRHRFTLTGGLCVALASFVAYELALTRRGREPLFDFRLLRYLGFRYGLLTVSVVALGECRILFILSLYLQEVRNLSALDTGLLLLPFAGGAFLTAPIAGVLSARVGPK
jgi:hypothetical protein